MYSSIHLPDPAVCRCRQSEGYTWSCLVENSAGCLYRLDLGYDNVCMHPDVGEIAAAQVDQNS